jgi:hypothetical protein
MMLRTAPARDDENFTTEQSWWGSLFWPACGIVSPAINVLDTRSPHIMTLWGYYRRGALEHRETTGNGRSITFLHTRPSSD